MLNVYRLTYIKQWCGVVCVCVCVGLLFDMIFRSAGPQTIPSQTYDYAALNAFALAPQASVGNDNMSTMECQPDVSDGGLGNLSTESISCGLGGEGEEEEEGEEKEEEEDVDSNNNTNTPGNEK